MFVHLNRGMASYSRRPMRRRASRGPRSYEAQNQDYEPDHGMFIALSTQNIENSENETITFINDSGATHNFIQEKYEKYITDIQNLDTPINIKIANVQTIVAKKKGILKTLKVQEKIIDHRSTDSKQLEP